MKRDALVVGINRYPFLKDSFKSTVRHLTTPASDAEAIAQLLESYGNFRVKRLPESNIDGKLQVDPNKIVRAEELKAAIANLFRPKSGRTPETALLFFAGHGLRNIKGEKSEGYLATSDANPRKDIWGVSLQWLHQLLQESLVRQQIIWLDCCFSGELLNFRETDLGEQWLGRDRETSHKDRFFLAASRDYEVAYQQLDGEHGVLSGAILKGLDPYQDPGYEWITNSTLTGAVEREIERSKIPQSPLIVNYGEKIHLIQKKGRTPFITSENFFRGWLDSDKPFNHAWKLEGRTDYIQSLNEFVESRQERIAILPGRGGIGKTKLLHAFAENFEHSEFILRFVEEGVSVTRENIYNLPARPCVVVLDDAHRREQDVSTLLTLVRQRTDIKLLLSSRPYAVNYLQKLLRDAGINSRQIQQLDQLRELNREEVKALARQALGSEYARFADRLASVTKDCPLVTVVGGRLLAERAISPDLLERDADFQHDVLSRFQDALIGQVSQRIEPEFCRELLNLIAAVAPIRLTNDLFQEVAAEFLKVERPQLVSSIGILEQSGILLRRGDTLRITPDVLADHILNEACLTPQGESTGYTQEVFKKFQDICPTAVLQNLAELDWRIRHTSDGETDLLADIWQEIRKEFRMASNSGRYRLLELFRDVAYYQPEQTLELVKLAMRPATTPEEKKFSDFYTHDIVLHQLPELLERISYSYTLKYLPYCCDLLWKLGRDDSREQYSRFKHAMDVLTDLAKYDIDKPLTFNQKVLESVERWLKKPDAHAHIYSPLDVLNPLLRKSGDSSSLRGSQLVVRQFTLTCEDIQPIRKQALNLISDCLALNQPKIALRALQILEKALEEPVDHLSQRISEQCEQWVPEQIQILELINTLFKRKTQALISLEVIRVLRWHIHLGYSEEVRQKALEIIKSISDTYELRLTGVLANIDALDWLLNNKGNIDLGSFTHNWEEREQRVNKVCFAVVEEFLRRYPEANEAVQVLNKELNAITESGVEPLASSFLDTLREVVDLNYAVKMCEAIVEAPSSPLATHFSSLLYKVRKADVHRAIIIAQRAVSTDSPILCTSLAQKYWTWNDNLQSEDVELIKKLLSHNDVGVRKNAVTSLFTMKGLQPKLVSAMALTVEIGSSRELAIELFRVFGANSGISLDTLSDEELEKLLVKLEPVIDITEYHISQFLAHASKRLPRSVVQLLLKRIEYCEKNNDSSYHPLPYSKFRQKLDGLAESEEYEDIIRDILNQALKESGKRFWLSKLFKEVSLDFTSISLKVLDEWINSGELEKVQAASCLLGDVPQSFVFTHIEFISNLIEQAYELGDDCYRAVSYTLAQSVTSGVRSGTLGQPFPEDAALKDRASNIAEQFILGSPSHQFYQSLARKAKASIQFWEKMWEEFDEQ
jgi:hypothetical protein